MSLVSFIRAVFIHSLHTPKPTFLQPQALDRRNQISTQKPRFYLAGLGTVFTLRVSTVLEAASPSPSQHRGWGRAEKSFRDPSPFVQWVGGGGRVKALEGARGPGSAPRRAPRLLQSALGPCFTAFLCITDSRGEKSIKVR